MNGAAPLEVLGWAQQTGSHFVELEKLRENSTIVIHLGYALG